VLCDHLVYLSVFLFFTSSEILNHGRKDHAGYNAIQSDVFGGIDDGSHTREMQERSFRSRVRYLRLSQIGNPSNARVIDDSAGALLLHYGQNVVACKIDACQVQCQL
jgi:hypothetical protein